MMMGNKGKSSLFNSGTKGQRPAFTAEQIAEFQKIAAGSAGIEKSASSAVTKLRTTSSSTSTAFSGDSIGSEGVAKAATTTFASVMWNALTGQTAPTVDTSHRIN